MSRRLRALVIEDDTAVREALTSSLQLDKDIFVEQAASLEEGINKATAYEQMVILVDAGRNGASAEIVAQLHHHFPFVPLVVITGGSEEVVAPMKKAGANAVIMKGSEDCEGEHLVNRVRAAIVEHDLVLMAEPMTNRIDRMDEMLEKARKVEVKIEAKKDSIAAGAGS